MPCKDGDVIVFCLVPVILLVSADQMRHYFVGQKQASYSPKLTWVPGIITQRQSCCLQKSSSGPNNKVLRCVTPQINYF